MGYLKHFSPELEECVVGHEEAVIVQDEYKIQELFDADPNIEYIVDIGANVGAASYQFQRYFPNAKILSCEPDPECMKYVKLNTDNKLIYVEGAITGDNRREVTFNICKWRGNNHIEGNFRWDLFEPMGSKLDHEITVPASTLKDIVDKHNFPKIDLLKVDTEGMEGQILTAFKPYMSLVKHFRGEWHGREDSEIMKAALSDTHCIFISRVNTTHGDFFAIRKDVAEKLKVIEENNGYSIIKTPGLPDRIATN